MKKDWTYKKLGEVATIYDSQRKPVTKKDRKPGPYPYYGATGVQDYVDKYIFDGRYVLVGEDGARWSSNEKSAYIIEGKSWVNNHAHVLSFDNSIIDCFIVYYLNYSNLDPYITGAIIKKLTQKDLLSISIPIPPLSIQRSIVAELDLLHSVISKKKEQLRELDNLAQSLFYQMFGDPITNPMGWEIKKLGEVAPVKSYQGDIVSEKGLYWLLNLDMVEAQTGKILEKNMLDKDEIGNSTTSFSPDNVLYSKLRPYLNKVVLPDTCGYCTTELLPLLPQKDILNREYLCYLLRSKSFVDYINTKVAGAKMPRVTMDDFRNFPIPLPPLSLQQSFAAKVSAIEAQKQAITLSIKETEALLAQRMDTYFS